MTVPERKQVLEILKDALKSEEQEMNESSDSVDGNLPPNVLGTARLK